MFCAGILAWGAFNTAIDVTNSTEFCIGCHEMENNVYQEYVQTSHSSNRSGVAASCTDCHVPKEWGPKVLRKIYASNELYHAILGTIDTPEKFETHRLAMAERVWESMRETDSRECRNCHDYAAMDLELQDRRAGRRHDPEKLAETGKTCIDCHQGVAHELPEDY